MSSTEDYLDSLLANAQKNTKSQPKTQEKAESTLSEKVVVKEPAQKTRARSVSSSEAELDALLRGEIKTLSDAKEGSSFSVSENNEEPAGERRMTSEEIDALLASVDIDEQLGIDESIEDPVEKILSISEEHIASEENGNLINVDDNSLLDEFKQMDAGILEGHEEPNIVEVSEQMLEQMESVQESGDINANAEEDAGRMMSPEEIAAIIAQAGQDMQQESEEQPEQDILEEILEDIPEEIPEEIPDEISEEISEPAVEPDDPNKMMSPEDIEALLASMGADEPDASVEEAAEDIPEEISEVISEEISEEIPVEAPERTLTLENGEEVSLDTPIGQLLGEDMDDEADGEAMADDSLGGLGDFSEDDIEKMLNEAADVSDVKSGTEDMEDVTDLLSELGEDDEDLGDIADTLKASDENVLVDNSLMDKLDKAEQAGNQEDESDEDAADGSDEEDSSKKKKKKKEGFLSKIFGGKNKKKKNSEDDEEAGETDDTEVEKTSAKSGKQKKSDEADDMDTSIFEDILHDDSSSKTTANKSEEADSSEIKETSDTSNVVDLTDLAGLDGLAVDDDGDMMPPVEAAEEEPDNKESENKESENKESENKDVSLKKSEPDDDEDDDEEDDDDEVNGKKGKKGKKKKKKKPGLIARIIALLTEEVDDDSIPAEASEIQLSEENAQILAEVDAEEDPKAKKKKKKEEEKAKKKEKAAEKKAEAEKKKRKKEAEKQEKLKAAKAEDVKKIPKKHVRASVLFALSIFVVIFLINSYVPKLLTLSDARKSFYKADYNDAFLKMYGKKLNESDQLLYDKARVVVLLQRKYESYENYKRMSMKKEALNALMGGLKKYDEIIETAQMLDMDDELDVLKDKILAALYNDYGVTEAEAKEALNYGDIDYTRKLDAIINGVPFNKLADEINVKYGFSSDEILNDPEAFYNEYPDMLPEEKEFLDSQQSDLYEQLLEE